MMNKIMKNNSINKNNMVVFDEIIIGDNGKLLKVLGERRKSDGGNNHVVQARESSQECYIPFSMADGSTPFSVFIQLVEISLNHCTNNERTKEIDGPPWTQTW